MKRPDLRIVNGQALHVVLDGADRGGTPVALVGGLAGNWFDWDSVTALLAADRVIVRFDRPGFGFSPASTEAPTARGEADRIAAVLSAVGVDGPVIVVAHSLGGFYGETFARMHPDRTAALVLLDASVGVGVTRLVGRRWRLTLARRAAAVLTGTGLQGRFAVTAWRLLDRSSDAAGVREAWVRRIWRTPSFLEAALVENAAYPDLAREVIALRRTATLPPVPVVVVAAHTGRRTPWGAAWLRRQRLLASTLTARFEVLRPAHHLVMVDQPERLATLVRTVAGPDPRR
ncbi:alpha/beta fold hydrolase [Rhodococcus gannanensis]|uniref:Alpha/beta fold hydrolase n=1 Tax=Rhodococcus gannanensis TaxID=1960308 RepID=A0ABW4P1D0_9NOCA